jgi:uncharacterized delta-60 repeat protein
MLKRSTLISLLLVALTAASASLAASGGPSLRVDRSFGRGGAEEVRSGPFFWSTAFNTLVTLSDGKLMATRGNGSQPGGYIRRYEADGSLDPSFPTTRSPTREDHSVAQRALFEAIDLRGFEIGQVVPLPSGKTLVAGEIVVELPAEEGAGPKLFEIAVARLGADGALDAGFGNGGIVRFKADLGIGDEDLVGIEARPGGGAAVAARVEPAPWRESQVVLRSSSSVVALDATGRIDTSFAGGTLRLDDTIESISVLDDGSVLVTGERWGEQLPGREAHRSDVVLSRYTPTGQPDPGFAAGGTLVLHLAGMDLLGAAVWKEDGSAWLGGVASRVESANCRRFHNFCPETPFVVPVSAEGALDAGIGTRGVLTFDELAYPYGGDSGGIGVMAMAPRPGGGVYAAGGSGTVAFIAALDPQGRRDRAFGGDGTITEADPVPGSSEGHAIAVDRQGRLLVAGGSVEGAATGAPVGALFRFRSDGALDRSFGAGRGYVRLPGHGEGLALGSDGGAFVLSAREPLAVTKVSPRGHPDFSFGEEGTVALPASVSIPWRDRRRRLPVQPKSIAALPDGRVLVAGTAGKEEARAVLFRLRAHGGFDPAFGDHGVVIRDCGPETSCRIEQMALQRDGRILLVGEAEPQPYEYRTEALAVMRLLPDGGRDHSFGRDGLAVRRIGYRSYGSALAVDPGGRILVAGRTSRAYRVREVLLRLRPDGRIDRTFGRRGVVRRPLGYFPNGFAEHPRQILLLGGRILVLRDAYHHQLLTYSLDGRDRRAYRVSRGAEVATHAGRAPFAAVQGGRLVLGWQVRDRPGKHLKLQRLLLDP